MRFTIKRREKRDVSEEKVRELEWVKKDSKGAVPDQCTYKLSLKKKKKKLE